MIIKKWWFWVSAGIVLLGIIGISAISSSRQVELEPAGVVKVYEVDKDIPAGEYAIAPIGSTGNVVVSVAGKEVFSGELDKERLITIRPGQSIRLTGCVLLEKRKTEKPEKALKCHGNSI